MTTTNSQTYNKMNMNNQTVNELRALAKERGLRGYYKLKKADLISLLEDRPKRPVRRSGERRPLRQVIVLPTPEAMDNFERKEMSKKRSVVKKKLNEWYDWLVNYVPQHVKEPVANAFSRMKSSILETYNGVKKNLGLKDEVEKIADQKHEEEAAEDLTPVEHEQAFRGSYKSFRVAGMEKTDIDKYMEEVRPHLKTLCEEQLQRLGSAKVQLHMWVMWKKEEEVLLSLEDGEMTTTRVDQKDMGYKSRMMEMFAGSDIDEILEAMFAYIKTLVEHPKLPKSGFSIDHIMHLDIDFHRLVLIRGGSYIPLPEWLAKKKAVINPKNTDEECFKWAVLAALHHEEVDVHPERITKLEPYAEQYDWSGLKFPVALNMIGKFEKNNPNIAINVLFTNKNSIYIGRKSQFNGERQKQANLLMVVDGENRHYTAVKNLSRLLTALNTKHKAGYIYCMNCLNGFHKESARDKHYEYCSSHGEVKIKMPKENKKWLQYHDGQCQFKVPFMLYADFESILKPMDERYKDKINQLKSKRKGESYTEKINTHVPSGWCVYSKFAYGDVPDPLKLYRGKDCVETFVEHIEAEVKRLYETFPQQPMMELTDILEREHEAVETCHICFKPFDDPKNRKVRDHCHYTGIYRGAAHNSCNLKYRIPDHIPIAFHNLSGYDAHLFIRELGRKFNKEDIGVIAENKEKYISFSVKINVKLAGVTDKDGKPVYKKVQLRFIDSCRFMASSLDKLASNLADKQCENLRQFYSEEEKFKLMRRKGVYPYEYMDSWERFEEVKLPPQQAFFSKLNMAGISDKDYEHAQKVWNTMSEKTLGCYHDTYLKTDVLLLADVFESFRDTCLKHYKLDPAHFYTAPGLAWKAALKVTGVKLELLTDIDMLLMFERGIRGGITQAVKRYAKANNKYMGEQYNADLESIYTQYLDANNLYGGAMVKKLPTHGFRWISDVDEFTTENIAKLVKKDKKGYILEVDVDYPKGLHKKHNELPFLPEKMKIHKVEKLVPNLKDKKNYVVHIEALHQALQHGLVLKKVHIGIQFEQSAWLKPYIMMNIELRKAAISEFEKDFFKLMINAVFGKTMENKREHKDIRLATNQSKYEKYVMKPNFKAPGTRFTDNLMAVEMGKTEILMDKPVYLGQTILDLSKMVMYEFHYDYMHPKYGRKVKLCYMDTDSFVYEIKTEDFYRDISEDVEARFDTSNYDNKGAYTKDEFRPLDIGQNKKILLMMKDELGGKIMTEFVALRAKMYAYKKIDVKSEDKRCKGTKKCVVAQTLTFEDYKQCLFAGNTVYREQMLFEHKKHEVFTVNKCKIALNRDDDKRIIQDDGITTLARGYAAAS